jgi:hypothetical protein
MQAYWNIERLTFTPTGTGSSGPYSFNTVSAAPSPSLTDLSTYTLTGSISQESLSGGSIVVVRDGEPKKRVCLTDGNVCTAVMVYNIGGIQNSDQFRFSIGYNTGTSKWRLLYLLRFGLDGNYTIGNPAVRTTGTLVNSATISLFNVSLNWEARLASGTFTGTGLTATEAYYTY